MRSVYHWQRRIRRVSFLRAKLQELIDNPNMALDDPKVLNDLSHGWSNRNAASNEYLLKIIDYTSKTALPILECGSGLSTLVCGLAAKKHGKTLWTLESSKPWYRRIRRYLDEFQIDSVKLIYSPLVSHGDFYWYDAPFKSMPESFSLVICDGPSNEDQARRYGLFPLMKQRFSPGCVILFDNNDAEPEQEGLHYWMKELNLSSQVVECEKLFVILQTPATS